MQEMIITLMDQFGYFGILLLIAVENIFPPIPSEVILTFGGFMTTYTSLNVAGVIVFSTIGSLMGAVVLYGIGRIFNKERLMKIVSGRIGKMLRLKAKDIESAESWFEKIINDDNNGRKIALLTYTANEKLCHRSIIGEILRDRGCNVIFDKDTKRGCN